MIYEAEITAIPEGEGLAKTKAAVDQENIYQSQLIIGMQIGLVVLAAFVTRSSALSLQAKHGLPVGNQIVGWMTLGRSSLSSDRMHAQMADLP